VPPFQFFDGDAITCRGFGQVHVPFKNGQHECGATAPVPR
jgi:hypothetical protein